MKRIPAILFLLSLNAAWAQEHRTDSVSVKKDSVTLQELNKYFTYQDSLDIFTLIDSLLNLKTEKGPSQLAVRIGYNSNIVADAVTFNISQFGLAPGISYYHKSGAYADLTTYYSQEYNPNFYLTVASAGYIYTPKKFYTALAEYSHYFYNQPKDSTVSVPYTNNLGLTNYFEIKSFVLRLDYYFYFGQQTAHRLMPGVGFNLVKRKWAGFDRVSFYPNTSVLFGSETITNYELYPDVVNRLIYNRTHNPKLPLYYNINSVEFGVMNYSFSAPIVFTKKNWTFLLNYTYNLPQALPGENLSLQDGGYLSFSITRYIPFNKAKQAVAVFR